MMRNFGWLFGFGATDEKPRSNQVKKSINPQWIPDGQGDYIKVNRSTTAAALDSLANPLNPLSDKTSSLSREAISALGKTTLGALSDDGDVIDNSNLDALSLYQEELRKTAATLQSSLYKWKLLKEEMIGEDTSLSQSANIKTNSNYSVGHQLTEFFKNLSGKIQANLAAANTELHDLWQKTHDAVHVLCSHLENACRDLNDTSKTKQERREICVDMCNTSIEISTALIVMIDNIQTELTHCLQCEQIAEQIAKQILLLLVLMVTRIPLPDLDFNFSESYRNFLINEIQKEKIEIEIFETDVMGTLRKTMQEIKKQEVEWVEAKKKAIEQNEQTGNLKELKTGEDKFFLMSAQNQKHDAIIPDSSANAVASASNSM